MNRRNTRSGDAPLLAWGDALRAKRLERQRFWRRAGAISALPALLGVTIAAPPAPRLVWNASASAPLGLYAVSANALPTTGDMVIAWVPKPARILAAERRYIPINVPLVKRVAAVAGDDICADGPTVRINGHPIATRRAIDGAGRPMPWWHGCIRLRDGDYFLLMTGAPTSFDGRYFGITQRADIVGKARPLWTW